jgi:hypothetical protein
LGIINILAFRVSVSEPNRLFARGGIIAANKRQKTLMLLGQILYCRGDVAPMPQTPANAIVVQSEGVCFSVNESALEGVG